MLHILQWYKIVGDFSFYDHVLDLLCTLGAIPKRFGFDAANLTLTQTETAALLKKEALEIIETEIAHKTSNIYNPDYQPIFIRNLDEQQKEYLTEIINEKIKNIKFAISKSQISKCENEK